MQHIQQSLSVETPVAFTKYSVRQRLMSGSLSLAVTSSVAVSASFANTAPQAFVHNPVTNFAGGPVHVVHPVSPTVHNVHPVITSNLGHAWHPGSTNLVHSLATQLPGASDLNLTSSSALFSVGTLAGFTTITLDIGGHQTTIDANTKLTGAELVAAQQVISGGHQTLTLGSSGAASGGTFSLNNGSVSFLDSHVGGTIGSLDVSHGVTAVDSVKSLNLSGSLVNQGTIDLASSVKGQTDTISAASINNSGVIQSAGHSGAAITLNTTGNFTNSGKITSATDLSVSAATITNSGALTAKTGNVNISGVAGGDINVNNAGGTVQAANGAINFNDANYSGSGNVTLSGGNWLSQQVNFNAGTGAINANVGELTGVIGGNAGSSHITSATSNMQLGNIDVSGDPTYFNTAGSISIVGTVNGDPDLAIVASGNIVGGGGALDTSAGNGNITLIAGASFTTTGGTSTTTTSSGADTKNTITVVNSATAGKGSATGGYIDLSGKTLGKGTALSNITSGNGNILMVAYKGSAANSGSIIGTGTVKTGGSTTISAGTGAVQLIGGGTQITAQDITGGSVSITAGTPVISGGTGKVAILDGSIVAGSGTYSVPGTPSNTAVNVTNLTSTGAGADTIISAGGKLTVATGGTLTAPASGALLITMGSSNSTAAAPINVNATILTPTGTTSTGSLFLVDTGGSTLNIEGANIGTGGTLSIKSAAGIYIGGLAPVQTAGNLILNSGKGILAAGGDVIGGGTATLTDTTGFGINVNTAYNTLSANSAGGFVGITESTSSAKALTVNASTGSSFVLTSTQPVTTKGAITTTFGDIKLSESGTNSVTGLNIASVLTAGSNKITLSTTGSDNIIGSKPVVASNIVINAGGAVGTASAGFQTKAGTSLIVNGTSAAIAPVLANIKDLGTTALNLSGTSSSATQNVQVSSAAPAFNVGQLNFTGVTLSDTVAGAVTTLNPGAGNTIGNGAGPVKVTSAGNIVQGAGNIAGSLVTLTSTSGSVGAVGAGNAINVSATSLTANATKGNVEIQGLKSMTLNAGTALTDYEVIMNLPTFLNIGGTIAVTTKVAGTETIGAAVITQGPATAFLSAANITLETLAGGSIGVGPGFQSIQTKAINSLSITGGNSSTAFVTQTGSLTLTAASIMTAAAGSTLNLAMATGSKLTVENAIAWDNNNISAPTSLTVGVGAATGTIGGTNATITSPTVVINTGSAIGVTAAGTASFISPAALSVTGGGTVTLPAGSSLSLFGQTAITLGNATPLNDPLATGINSAKLGNLTIFSKGLFTGAYSSFFTGNTNAVDTLSVTASNIKNSGAVTTNAFLLTANGTTSNNITLNLTGGQNVTLNNGSVGAGQVNYSLTATGSAGSSISASAVGMLTVNPTGVNFLQNSGNTIALNGRTLVSTLPSTEFSSGIFHSVTLGSAAGTVFTVGATTAAELKNGIAGTITVDKTGFVSISAPTGITVNDTNVITGNQLAFNTASFKLLGNSGVAGTGFPSALTFTSGTGLTIGGTGGTNNIGGTYTGITNVTLQSATGAINAGKLFTTANGAGNMLDGGNVSGITLSAATSITLDPSIGTLQTANNGFIFISAASLSSPTQAKAAQTFLSLQSVSGQVNLILTNPITLGTAASNVDINVGVNGGFTASSAGALTVNETQTVNNAFLAGSSITVNKSVTASAGLSVQALGNPSSAITEGVGAIIATTGVAQLTLAQGVQALPATALNIQTGDLSLVSGAFNLNNTFAGNVVVGQKLSLAPLTALNLVNTSGMSGPGGSLLAIGTLLVSAGGINIVNTNGNIFVQNNAKLSTAAGSISVPVTPPTTPATFKSVPTTGGGITLENDDKSGGTIEVGLGVTMNTFSTVAGGGQINIVMGKVPTTGLLAGTQSTPTPTLNNTSGGGQIFFTTTANPTGSITSGQINILNAKGTNIVFNGNGSNTAIKLDGNDTITADPVVAASSTLPAVTSSLINPISAVSAAPVVSNAGAINTYGLNQNAVQAPSLNWSLPTTAAINTNANSNFQAGADIGLAGIDDSTVMSGGVGSSANGSLTGTTSGGDKVLTGGVSNVSVKTMGNGATLISPKTQTTLNYGFGSVNLAAGSVVMVMAFDGGLAVYNLHDTKSGAVVVKVGDNTLKLSPGQNAVVTNKQIRCFEEINPAQTVAYRSMVGNELGNGVKSFKSEFSILTMLRSYDALRNMVRAQDSDTRKAVNSMLKTSAILSQLGGEQYEFMAAPAKTAMSVR